MSSDSTPATEADGRAKISEESGERVANRPGESSGTASPTATHATDEPIAAAGPTTILNYR